MIATAPVLGCTCGTLAPTASERVEVAIPSLPVVSQRAMAVKVLNSGPGGSVAMDSLPCFVILLEEKQRKAVAWRGKGFYAVMGRNEQDSR
jgi:hypothetical protein